MQITAIPAQRALDGIESFTMRLAEPSRVPRLRRPMLSVSLSMRVAFFSFAILTLAAVGADLVLHAADARVVQPLPEAAPAADTAPVAPAWREIVRPIQLFELAGSEFGRLPLDYRARRREGADERQDFLTYGHFGDGGPFLALSVLRRDKPAPPADFFVAMARLGADQNLSVTRSAVPTLLPTRFGPFAIADLTLARAAQAVPCLGFRLESTGGAASAIDIGGFACGTSGHVMDRALLGCVLDRIDLVSAGDDDTLRDVFVAAERRRGQQCAASRLLAAGTKNLWLDADASPPALRRLPGTKSHTP